MDFSAGLRLWCGGREGKGAMAGRGRRSCTSELATCRRALQRPNYSVHRLFDGDEDKKPIQYVGRAFFEQAENSCPGTLLNNCSYDLWKARYVDAGLQEEAATASNDERGDNSDQQLRGPRDRNKHLRQAVEKERRSSSDQSWLDDWVLNVEIVHQDNHGVELQDEQGNPISSKYR